MYSSASSYRFRPLGPEETLMEIWSMTRYAEGEESPRPQPPEVWAHDDPRWPPIPAQDFSNLPRQQRSVGRPHKGHMWSRVSAGRDRTPFGRSGTVERGFSDQIIESDSRSGAVWRTSTSKDISGLWDILRTRWLAGSALMRGEA